MELDSERAGSDGTGQEKSGSKGTGKTKGWF